MPHLLGPCPPGLHEIPTRKHFRSLPTTARKQVGECLPRGQQMPLQGPEPCMRGAQVCPRLTWVWHTHSGGGGAVPNASGRPPGLCCSSPIKHPMFRLWPGPLWTQAVYQALARTSFIPASLTHRCPRRRPRSKPFQVRTLMQVPSGHAPAMQGQEGPGSPHSRDRQVPSLQPGPSALSPVPLSVSLLSRRLGATAESALQKDL